jgi:shikimate kinase
MSDRPALTGRTIALVGLMGVGKSSIGRRLARALGLPFRDADSEIEKAAGRSVADIFSELGEPAFRDGERKVIARLLAGRAHVLATGGGAFADAETRGLLKEQAVTVWLRADLDTLVERVRRRNTRPLLRDKDPREVLAALMEKRHADYAQAEIVVETHPGPHDTAVQAIVAALRARLESAA